MVVMSTLNERIRDARVRAGLMQYQLAAALHVRPSAVSHWERGFRKPGRDMLARIAELTSTDLSRLQGLNGHRPLPQPEQIVVIAPQGKNLTAEERELLLFWRALTPRQRENFLKVIRVSVAVRRKIEGDT